MELSTQPRQFISGFGTTLTVLEWPSQIPDLNPVEHLWRDLKIAVKQCSLSNLTELEEIGELPKYRCAKLVASYPRRLKAVIAAIGASTKYGVKGLNTYVNVIFQFHFRLAKASHYFVIMGYCV